MLVQVNAVREFLSVVKTAKEINDKLGVSDVIRLRAKDSEFFVESSKSDSYFISTIITECVVIEEGNYFVNNADLKSLLECATQAGLQSIRVEVKDNELIIDGSTLGQIKCGIPGNQQPWKRSPLSREDIEWQILLEEEEGIKEVLKKVVEFPKDNLIKLELKKEDSNAYLSAVNNIGNIYVNSQVKLFTGSVYDCYFMLNTLLISKALTLGKGELRLYIAKESDGSVDWDKENKILKLEYPGISSLIFYCNKEQPNTLRAFESNYTTQTPRAKLVCQPSDFINVINWQQFNLLATDNLYLKYVDKFLHLSKSKEPSKQDSKLSITSSIGSWVDNFYSIESLTKVIKLLNKAVPLSLDLVEIEIDTDDYYYILFFRPTESQEGSFEIGIAFSQLLE